MITSPVSIFLLVLVIILLGPVVFRRLRIPPVVGMIIAGIAVGPYGFGLLERDASFRIFGEVGILYIMFQAAVEIDMFHLRQQYRRGVVFGLLSFTIPLIGGLLGSRWAFGVGWDTALLIASMYASHTLVSYPVVSRFGLQNTRGAVIAVCGTIVAVMLALLCLAAVVQTKLTGVFEVSAMMQLLLMTAIYCAVVGIIFPWVTRKFFLHNSDPVAQYIFILALVFIASLLAQIIGLEAILGAFYAGLVLNKMIPARSALMKNIRFLGDSIFIPYFLIGVGMLINVGVIFRGWDVLWVVLNMTVVALSTKWIAAFAAQRIFLLDRTERLLMFGLSGGKAAATIAATMIGYKYGMLSEDFMNGAVVMILICCIVASVVTERAAKRLRIRLTQRDLDQEQVGETEYARQIVSVSNPITADGLARVALFMRSRLNHNPMRVLFVRTGDDRATRAMGREAQQIVANAAEAMEVEVKQKERFDINVANAMGNYMVEKEATDLIIGMHRKASIVDTFFGSLIEQIIQKTNRMIIISRSFLPVDTVTRICVVVPQKAEFETGFHLWVTRVTTLAANIEAVITFVAFAETVDYIRTAMHEDGIEVGVKWELLDSYDDFITKTAYVAPEDLLVIIGARKGSISAAPELDQLPVYLQRNFSSHNLMMIYPRQF
ncbi:MAG: cation:proton antiporter [Muribaculaceae bacterium]|nr:cation:proton antiporter [Muribaculaceae bacterium]